MNDITQVVNEQPQEVNELEIDAVFRPISPDQSIVPDTPPQPKQPDSLQHDVTLAHYLLLLWLTPHPSVLLVLQLFNEAGCASLKYAYLSHDGLMITDVTSHYPISDLQYYCQGLSLDPMH